MVRLILLAALFSGAVTPNAFAGADDNEIIAEIDRHFSKVPAEFNRYRRVTLYGDTVSGAKPPQEEIDAEVRLYEAVKKVGLLKNPPEQVYWLCQNLLIFAPQTGTEFFKELADQASTPTAYRYCSVLSLVAGKAGERLAVAKLKSDDLATRQNWAMGLSGSAILDESAEPIMKAIQSEKDVAVKTNLLRALGLLGGKSVLTYLQEQARSATDDAIQTAALFACVESAGFDGIAFLEGIKPVGPMAEKEKTEGLKYLKTETSAESPNGFEVRNDPDFVARFGDLRRCPAIAWMEKKGLLEDQSVRNPRKLEAADKDELLNLLIDAKGFGLEAVKGSLFLSVAVADIDQLASLRAATWFSPNNFSNSRTKTLLILIRHARKSPAAIGERNK